MFRFGEKHPVVLEIVLVVVSFFAAGIGTAMGHMIAMNADLSSSLARIAIALVLLIIYHRSFTDEHPFDNLAIVLPTLLFAAWNLFYNLSSGMVFASPAVFVGAAITALAPALFEEVLFRGIFIHNLRQKGVGTLACMLVSALLFSAIHLTNLVGLDTTSVALQVGYSLVIGMVFAAIYLRNGSLLQIVAAHFLVDFTNRIFVEQASAASTLHLVAFAVLLVAEAAYALWLASGADAPKK